MELSREIQIYKYNTNYACMQPVKRRRRRRREKSQRKTLAQKNGDFKWIPEPEERQKVILLLNWRPKHNK
jgi:hypothetical protein